MTHPLTDHIIESELATPAHFTSGSLVGLFTHDHIRTATDWQLEQVIEWLRENLNCLEDVGNNCYLNKYLQSHALIDEKQLISDLKKEMRPQEDNQ